MKRILVISLSALLIAILFITAGPSLLANQDSGNSQTVKLERPLFLQQAYAQDIQGTSEIGQKLDAEAGISAYYHTPDPINLDQVRSAFRTIEAETANFIIGSVNVPGYEEHYDAHVYANTSGWLLAYYLNDAPVSKIIDIKNSTINTTNLASALSVVAGAAGAPFSGATYYDFRYPNATNMLFVYETYEDGNDFKIQLPSTFGYFERSWALVNWGFPNYFRVDGTDIGKAYWYDDRGYGWLTASQLLPDMQHTIQVDNNAVLVIVYRVP